MIASDNRQSDVDNRQSASDNLHGDADNSRSASDNRQSDADHCRRASDYLLRDQENSRSHHENLLVRADHVLRNPDYCLDDSNSLHDDGDNRHGRKEDGVDRAGHDLQGFVFINSSDHARQRGAEPVSVPGFSGFSTNVLPSRRPTAKARLHSLRESAAKPGASGGAWFGQRCLFAEGDEA